MRLRIFCCKTLLVILLAIPPTGGLQLQSSRNTASRPYLLLTCTTTFPTHVDTKSTELVQEWLDFTWKRGGKVPWLPPPIPLSKSITLRVVPIVASNQCPEDRHKLSTTTSSLVDPITRFLLPPGLIEQVTDYNHECIAYKVCNPSVWTFYPVTWHTGKVNFLPTTITTKSYQLWTMKWTVQVRPYHKMNWFVKTFTELIVGVLSRSFQQHCWNQLQQERQQGQEINTLSYDTQLEDPELLWVELGNEAME